jgi:hypothetical protein
METKAPESSDAYRVVVFARPDDPAELAEVLNRVLGIHPTDALVHARGAPGALPEKLTRERAEVLVAEIAQLGLSAQALPAAEIPEFEHVVAVHRSACSDAGLDVQGLHEEQHFAVPWGDIELIAIGQVPQEIARHYATGEMAALSAARRTSKPPVDLPLPPGAAAWIVCRNPERELRIDHKRMNYEYLGKRKTFSATANFRLFIDDIIARTPHAYLTPSTRDFLERGSVSSYSFDSPEKLKQDAILHLVIRRRSAAAVRGEN